MSREVRAEKKTDKILPGINRKIIYEVPNFEILNSPMKKNGSGYKKAFLSFKTNYLDKNILNVLPNGFIVFTPNYFSMEKDAINSMSK